MSSAASPEDALAAFVRDADVPAAATDRVALAFVDFALCVIAGARTPTGRRILDAARGNAAMTPEFRLAALGHVLDCDDNHDTIGGHPSCVLVPALLHGTRRSGRTVRDLLVPYVVGLEVMAAVARSLGRAPYEKGWHTTCIYGVLGAASAVARADASAPEVTVAALGSAATMASGIKASFGTDAKPLQVGHAASAGVLAHRLAAAGCTSSGTALSGPQGLAAVLDVTGPRWDELSGLGGRWETLDPGIVFKRFPCCATTHAPIEAVLALRHDGAEPPRLDVTVHAGRLRHVDRPVPRTPLDAKFSLQFTAAAAWVDGRCSTEQFTAERLGDERVRDVMRQVTVRGATDIPWTTATVGCTTRAGTRVVSIPAAVGHTADTPISFDHVAAKAESLGIAPRDLAAIGDLVLTGTTPAARLVGALDAAVAQNATGSCAQPHRLQ
ncbi:MAG TPA: MmgE/PrpD family protein [Streptosporangiales bacterium]